MRTCRKATMMPHGMGSLLKRWKRATTRTMMLVSTMARLKKPMRPTWTLDGSLPIFEQPEGIFPLWPLHLTPVAHNTLCLPALVREGANQKGKANRRVPKAVERTRILPGRDHQPQGLHPTLEVVPTVSFVAKLDILLRNVPVDHQSQKEHLPALPQRGSRQPMR